jgi:hypothetical protein
MLAGSTIYQQLSDAAKDFSTSTILGVFATAQSSPIVSGCTL